MTLLDYAPVPEELPQFLAGVLMLAIAALVLRVRFGAALNRAFALYLVLAGVYNVFGALDDTASIRAFSLATFPYFLLAIPWALVHLALRYREAEDGTTSPRWLSWSLLAGAVAVVGMYAADHGAYAQAGTAGWLSVFSLPLALLVSAAVSLAFAFRAARAPSTTQRDGLAAGAVAFAPLVVLYGASSITSFVADGVDATAAFGAAAVAGLVVRLAALVVAVVSLARLARLVPAWAPRILALGGLAGLTGVAGIMLDRAGVAGAGNLAQGIWQLALPVLLGWAILRHQLFGLDVKVRFAISKSTLAAAFVAVFFVASEGAQILFGAENQIVGLVAAGALVFAIAPLQRVADRLAERAVPVAGASVTAPVAPRPDDAGARDAYRVLLRRFVADGHISRDEERALARAAERFGLSHEETVALRHEVEDELRTLQD